MKFLRDMTKPPPTVDELAYRWLVDWFMKPIGAGSNNLERFRDWHEVSRLYAPSMHGCDSTIDESYRQSFIHSLVTHQLEHIDIEVVPSHPEPKFAITGHKASGVKNPSWSGLFAHLEDNGVLNDEVIPGLFAHLAKEWSVLATEIQSRVEHAMHSLNAQRLVPHLVIVQPWWVEFLVGVGAGSTNYFRGCRVIGSATEWVFPRVEIESMYGRFWPIRDEELEIRRTQNEELFRREYVELLKRKG